MMRITRVEGSPRVHTLCVEGRITHDDATEFTSTCEWLLADRRPLLLDLSAVRFADAAGVGAIRHTVELGGVVIGCSGFLAELLRASAERKDEP